jgi:regulation of enolase protein 1 (concanavalin A-like superfamily)
MDPSAVMHRRSLVHSVALISAVLSGCSSPPPNNTVPPTPTPSPINGAAVTRNTNVSFNTYSKEWPVGWEFLDPDPHPRTLFDTNEKVLHFVVPRGKDLSLERDTAPRYLKAIAGDFEIETKIIGRPVLNYQGAGLLVWADKEHYVRFERAYGGKEGGAGGIAISVRDGTEMTRLATTAQIPTESDETWLRVRRQGSRLIFLWRDAADGRWNEAARTTVGYPGSVLTGLVAVNTAADLDIRFGHIRLEPLSTK